ncbi:ABC transporter permease [Vulcanisaeta thermophila]|uniref:ABC transporter permease n=1 Tax=Vulcanisaeta thermophila TaxID=867917 RepID=UPI000853A592|nr:ABC transporter permease [Vulcanisaeta thermophila]
MGLIDRLYAFIVLRGWKMWVSYRTQVLLTIINWVIPVFIYFFIGLTLGFRRVEVISYTSFVVVGIAFQGYFSASVTTLAGRIRNEELIGTLEYLFATPLSPLTLFLYSSLWGLVVNVISTVLTLLIGIGLGVRFNVNPISTAVILALYILSILGLNLIAGSVVLIVKQGNPIALFTSVASNLLGGVVFPVTVLPTWLRYISYALSITWALDGLRASMLNDAPLMSIWPFVWPLAVLTTVYLVIALVLVSYAFRRVMVEGSVRMY